MEHKVSVIIPCYNGERFAERCLKSIYEQDYSSVEIIVIDDGSTDHSREKVLSWKERMGKKGYELSCITQKNQGTGGAVNTGLKYVTGEYLTLLDVDDEFLEGALKEKAAFLWEHPHVHAVRSNGWRIKGTEKFLFIQDEREKQMEDLFLALLRGETNNWAGSYMVRTKKLFQFYRDREIYPSPYGQNLQILLPVVYRGSCGYIDKPHMNYIQQPESLSQTANKLEREAKERKNAEGYLDIRIHMVKLIEKDRGKCEQYMREIQGAYWRGIMQISLSFHNKKKMLEAYKMLKKYASPTLDDRIVKFRLTSPKLVLLLKIMRKIRNLSLIGRN